MRGIYGPGAVVASGPPDAFYREGTMRKVILPQSLLAAGQIDEVQLMVCPVILSEGKGLFSPEFAAPALSLLSTRSFDRGTVLLAYTAAQAEGKSAKRPIGRSRGSRKPAPRARR